MTKLETLMDIEGIDNDNLEEYVMDSVQPGICMNKGCEYTTSVEPDSDSGWCENCDSNTVMSLAMLLGVI